MALSKISHRNPITQFQLNCTILLLFTMAFNNVFLSFFCLWLLWYDVFVFASRRQKQTCFDDILASRVRQASGRSAGCWSKNRNTSLFFYSGRNHTGDSLFKVPAVVFCSFSSACCSSWSMSVMRFFSSLPRSPAAVLNSRENMAWGSLGS